MCIDKHDKSCYNIGTVKIKITTANKSYLVTVPPIQAVAQTIISTSSRDKGKVIQAITKSAWQAHDL